MCSWSNKLGTNPWGKYLRWDSNMLLNNVYTPKFAEITSIACREPCAADGIVGTALDKTSSLMKIPCEQPHEGLCWLNELELIWGLRCAFLLSLPKQQIPVLLCPKLSKQKSYGNSTWSIYFVIYSDKEPNWGRFSWKPLLMELSTQGSRVGQEMAHLSHSCSPLKWWGWMHSSLLCQPPCPNTAWEAVACAGVGLCLRVLGPQQSHFFELCVFRLLPGWF